MKLKASLTKKFYIVPNWRKRYKEKVPWFKCYGDTSPIFEAIKGIIYTHSTHQSENTNQAEPGWQSAFNLCYPPELSLSFFFFFKVEYQFMQIVTMTGRSRYLKCFSRISEVPTIRKQGAVSDCQLIHAVSFGTSAGDILEAENKKKAPLWEWRLSIFIPSISS